MNSKRNFLKALTGATLIPAVAGAAGLAGTAPIVENGRSRFPNVWLKTHEGKDVRFYDDLLKGRNVLINVMYTACTSSCPPNTASLLQIQQALGARIGRDIHMYSLTIQPELDDPKALAAYVREHGIKPGWTYLTGRRSDVDEVRRSVGFFDSDPARDAQPTRHTGMVRIGKVPADRWAMVPALASKEHMLAVINGVI